MKILFDSNLWISFMIGKRLSSLADVLCRHDVEVYVSEQELDEIRRVIAREKFNKLISAETRYYFFEMVYDVCFVTDITIEAKSDIRDPKDLYLLSMAESVPVDFYYYFLPANNVDALAGSGEPLAGWGIMGTPALDGPPCHSNFLFLDYIIT